MSRRPPSTEHSSVTLACLQARRNELEQLQGPPDLFSWMASSRLYGDHQHRSTRSQSRETIRQARLSRPAISGTSISATLARFRPDCRQYFPNSVLAGWPVTGDLRPVLRPRRNEFSNGVRPADCERHAEYLRLEVPLRKRCAWLLATRPINLTPADAKLAGFGPQRKQLSLAPLIKIAREQKDIEINTAVL